MTESEWFDDDPSLAHVEHLVSIEVATDRKLWLLSIAHCRCIWHLLDRWERETVELAAMCVEGKSVRRRLEKRLGKVHTRRKPKNDYWYYTRPIVATVAHSELAIRRAGFQIWQKGGDDSREIEASGRAALVAPVSSNILFAVHANSDYSASEKMRERLVNGFHDLFGNPFRTTPLMNSWKTPSVISLARSIYRQMAFQRMPELAERLEHAGCADPHVLEHCRENPEHFRGCWVLDQLLDRK